MAKLSPVLPSLIGQGRSARLSSDVPRIPTGTEGLAGIGEAAKEVFNASLRLAQEGQHAALSRAQADYDLEVSEALEREVFSRKGLSAVDGEARADEIFRRAENRQLEKLGGAAGRDFQTMAVRSRASWLPRVLRHGETEVRGARIDSGKQVQANKLRLHSLTGNDAEIEDALAAYADVAAAEGMEVVDPDRFDRDAAEGFVRIGGVRREIRDGRFEGPDGPVSVSTLRDRIADTPYARGRQMLIDGAHSARVDRLLHWNDVAGAEALLEKYDPANGSGERSGIPRAKYPLSGRAHAAMKEQVGRRRALLDAELEGGAEVAARLADYAANDPLSLGGKLWSPGIEARTAEALAAQHRKTLDDPTGRERMKYRVMQQGFEQARHNALAWEKAQTEGLQRALRSWGGKGTDLLAPGNEAALVNAVGSMPRNYITEKFFSLAAHNLAVADRKLRNTPEAVAGRKAEMMEFARHAAAGVPLDLNKEGASRDAGLVFDLSDAEQREQAIALLGYDARDRQRLQNLMDAKVPVNLAAEQLAGLLRELPGLEGVSDQLALRVAPELIEELQKTASLFPDRKFNTEKDARWVKDQLRSILKTRVMAERTFWGTYREVTYPEHLKKYLTKDGALREPEPGEVGYRFREFRDGFCTTAEQLAAAEKIEQENRLFAIPRKAGETEEELAASRRAPWKADKLGSPEARAVREGLIPVDDGRGNTVYLTRDAAAAKEKREAEAAAALAAEKKAREQDLGRLLSGHSGRE